MAETGLSLEEIIQKCYDSTNNRLKIKIAGLTVTNDGTKTTIMGPTGDYTRFGDANTPQLQTFTSNDDVLVAGKFEAIGAASFAGGIILQAGYTLAASSSSASINLQGGTDAYSAYLQLFGKSEGSTPSALILSSGNAALNSVVERLRITGAVDTAAVTFSNCTVDLGTSCEADAYTVGGTAGTDFNGAVTNITVVKGIITAAS